MSKEKRPITIWSTSGNNRVDIESDAETLGELQRDFSQHRIAFKDMSIVCGENNNSLESTDAQLISGPITLFFFPRKVGSGAVDKAALLKTFKQSNATRKLTMAKKNGYSSVETFKAFLEGKGKTKVVAKVPAKVSTPVKPTKKAVVKSAPKGSPAKKVVPRPNVADVVKSVSKAKETAKLTDSELQNKARAIRSTITGVTSLKY